MFKGLYGKNLKNTTMKISCAQGPQKNPKEEIHDSQRKDSKRWSDSGEKNGESQLYKRMKLLAQREFELRDFQRDEYDSYCLILYKTMMNEIEYERLNLKYRAMFGDKWSNLSKENDEILYEYELNKIQIRVNESINRCEEFKCKEREFKKKYFQDPNYLIKGIDTF
tara:strand:- start:5053 stop:5553 length:501 start_codon:yes stop_codon:yes gene_type:complete